jgi:anti-sigma factor RsiW
MSDTSSAPPPGRKGASRRLRALRCPLSAEILVAEFAGELPPNVASAVRKHVANCVICGPRAEELRASYDLVGSLGAEPVVTTPDLRERVYIRTQTVPLARQRKRLALAFPRAIWGILIGALVVAVIGAFITQWLITPARTQAAMRSSNALTDVPAAGASGELLAATSTLIPVRDRSGEVWRVAEVVAADERTGAITRSLPASDMPAESGDPSTAPVAIRLTADGSTVVELTAPDGQKQALVSFDTHNGATQIVTPLALPAGTSAVSLALSSTEPLAFIGLRGEQPTVGPRALVIDLRSGALARTLTPAFNPTAPLAAPPTTLTGAAHATPRDPTPTVSITPTPSPTAAASPTPTPFIDATGWQIAQTARGDIALSPDGQWLFDVFAVTDPQGVHYAVLRRTSTALGQNQQEVALAGDFAFSALAAGGTSDHSYFYLARGSSNAELFILDAGAQGLALLGDLPLGGPDAAAGVSFTGALSLNVFSAGTLLYIAQDATSSDHQVSGHDLWLVDVTRAALLYRRADLLPLSGVLANTAGGSNSATFVLHDGQVALVDANLSGDFTPWINLKNGRSVTQLLGAVDG